MVASKTKEGLQEVASLLELHLQIYILQLHSPQKKTDVVFLKIWTTISVKETKPQQEIYQMYMEACNYWLIENFTYLYACLFYLIRNFILF